VAAAPAGFGLKREFLLGTKRTAFFALPEQIFAEKIPLSEAISRAVYWQLLDQGFPRDAGFLRRLLPFLAGLDSFTVIILRSKGEIHAMVTVGVAGRVALVMNAVVGEQFRGQGISRILAGAASDHSYRLGAEKAFFWTEHGFLGPYAEEQSRYRVWSKLAIHEPAES
jgi:hypothetical protein